MTPTITYGFLSLVKVEEVNDKSNAGRGLWSFIAPLIYRCKFNDKIYTVPVGFRTDWASVPRVPFLYLLCGDTAHPAAGLHDYLYSAPHKTDRATADKILKEAAISTGVPKWRAWMLYLGVRIGGASHWD